LTVDGSPETPSPFRRFLSGAAGGALAGAAIALFEILGREPGAPPPASPGLDLSLLAVAGTAVGAGLGLLRAIRGLSALAPFGVVLGGAAALHVWFGGAAGERLLGERALVTAASGALLVLAGALLGQLLGVALRRALPRRRPRLLLIAIPVLLALPALRSWIPPSRGPAGEVRADGPPNVLLLTIDTLRADRLGFTGCPRPLTPHLDRLARRGTVDVRAVTPLPRTLPAFASIMTGGQPPTHGVRDNFHYRLDEAALTLAERFARAGWVTAAVNSNPVLSHDSGIYQGFLSASDRGDDWSRLRLVRGPRRLRALLAMHFGDRARVIADEAIGWLGRRPADRPFFLWVHWLSPHMPYEPEPPFDRLWNPDPTVEYARAFDYGKISKGEMTYRNPLDAAARRRAANLYDGEVATADRAVGRLLAAMERAGDLDRTLILFTSDHGESLDEHGYFFNHGDFVYGPAANVPVIRVGFRGERPGSLHRAPTSLVDILPALLAEAGVPAGDSDDESAARIDGTWPPPERRPLVGESGFCRFPHLNDRLGYLLPRDVAQNPDLVGDWRSEWEERANRAKQRFVEIDGWKLVRSPRPDGDVLELFDLTTDPGETRDVSALHPELVAALSAELDAWIESSEARAGTAGDREIDDALRERMEALGYLGD
jgi:arylsulfatase A-like enzyme